MRKKCYNSLLEDQADKKEQIYGAADSLCFAAG